MLVGNAQLVAGGAEKIPAILKLLEKEGIGTVGNRDLFVRTYKHFGVDEARDIIARASLKAAPGARRVFVVAFTVTTNEAQNALLKTLEEPVGNALFIVLVPSPQMLLPTVRSRVQILEVSGDTLGGVVDARKFLSAPANTRLEMLKPLLEKDEDERRDIGPVIAFLAQLEKSIDAKNKKGLEAVYMARKYVGDKGALVKPLLEQVALLI